MTGGNDASGRDHLRARCGNHIRAAAPIFFGSMLARTVDNTGNAGIHYDRPPRDDFWVAGHPMVGSFTWKRY